MGKPFLPFDHHVSWSESICHKMGRKEFPPGIGQNKIIEQKLQELIDKICQRFYLFFNSKVTVKIST